MQLNGNPTRLRWIQNKFLLIHRLQTILDKALISPLLKRALSDSIKALEANDWNLAWQLTACKSYIVGSINAKDKRKAFQENDKSNEKILGRCVYSLLDGIHHDIAFFINAIPSGMMIMSKDQSGNMHCHTMKPKGVHPVIRRMEYEHMIMVAQAKQHQDNLEMTPTTNASTPINPPRHVNWKGNI